MNTLFTVLVLVLAWLIFRLSEAVYSPNSRQAQKFLELVTHLTDGGRRPIFHYAFHSGGRVYVWGPDDPQHIGVLAVNYAWEGLVREVLEAKGMPQVVEESYHHRIMATVAQEGQLPSGLTPCSAASPEGPGHLRTVFTSRQAQSR